MYSSWNEEQVKWFVACGPTNDFFINALQQWSGNSLHSTNIRSVLLWPGQLEHSAPHVGHGHWEYRQYKPTIFGWLFVFVIIVKLPYNQAYVMLAATMKDVVVAVATADDIQRWQDFALPLSKPNYSHKSSGFHRLIFRRVNWKLCFDIGARESCCESVNDYAWIE